MADVSIKPSHLARADIDSRHNNPLDHIIDLHDFMWRLRRCAQNVVGYRQEELYASTKPRHWETINEAHGRVYRPTAGLEMHTVWKSKMAPRLTIR